MGLYDLEYGNIIWQNIPVLLRDNVLFSWLKCLCTPVSYLYNLFVANRNNDLYVLSHNGQIAYLQAVLNDTFDPIARRIVIDDPEYADPLWIYKTTEGKTTWIGLTAEATNSYSPRWFFTTAERFGVHSVLFYVMVPAAVAAVAGYSETRLRALVDKYRLPGKKNYSVVVF